MMTVFITVIIDAKELR